MRVSVMMDSNGCNTTAAAAVVAAKKHVPLNGSTALVLGGTGPVGLRVAQLLAGEGCESNWHHDPTNVRRQSARHFPVVWIRLNWNQWLPVTPTIA